MQTEKVGTLSTLQDQTLFQLVQVGEVIPINTQIATRHVSLGERTGMGWGKAGDPAYTLQVGHEHGVCYCIAGNIVDRSETAGANGVGATENVSYTLNTVDRHAVAIVQPMPIQDKTGTLSPGAHAGSYNGQDAYNDMLVRCRVFDARGNGNGKIVPTITGDHESRITDYTAIVTEPEDCLTPWDNQARRIYSENGTFPALAAREKAGQNQQSILTETEVRWIVRRLTPTECERLQGYPDGWTDIGEWADTKGKKHKPADTPRYKALGNSIALPQWFWLVQKMRPYLKENPKLGSLFDGIGGFPLVWQRAYGKGTARWASEIEEFPIVVTKARFGND